MAITSGHGQCGIAGILVLAIASGIVFIAVNTLFRLVGRQETLPRRKDLAVIRDSLTDNELGFCISSGQGRTNRLAAALGRFFEKGGELRRSAIRQRLGLQAVSDLQGHALGQLLQDLLDPVIEIRGAAGGRDQAA